MSEPMQDLRHRPPLSPPTGAGASRPSSLSPDSSTWRLLAAIPFAAMRAVVGRIPPGAFGLLLTVCGLVSILSPLALWVSWNKEVFYAVLGIAAGALALAFGLVVFSRDEQHHT